MNFFCSCGQVRSHRPPNITRYYQCPWWPSSASQWDITYWVPEQGEHKLVFTWKLHSYWLSSIGLEGAMMLPGEESNNLFQLCMLQATEWLAGQGSPTGAIVAQMLQEQTTTFWLYSSSTPQDETHRCTVSGGKICGMIRLKALGENLLLLFC